MKPTLPRLTEIAAKAVKTTPRKIRGIAKEELVIDVRDAIVWIADNFGYKTIDIAEELRLTPKMVDRLWQQAKTKRSIPRFARVLRNVRIELKMNGYDIDVTPTKSTHSPFPEYTIAERRAMYNAMKSAKAFMKGFGKGKVPFDYEHLYFQGRKFL